MNIFEIISDFTNTQGKKFVDFVMQYFDALPSFIQALVLIGAGLLIIIGTISIIKSSFKLILALGVIFIILFILWTFVL